LECIHILFRLLNIQISKGNARGQIVGDDFGGRGRVPEGQPRFLIAYQNGNIQLMCNENISS
jgi:hypothetical protein